MTRLQYTNTLIGNSIHESIKPNTYVHENNENLKRTPDLIARQKYTCLQINVFQESTQNRSQRKVPR